MPNLDQKITLQVTTKDTKCRVAETAAELLLELDLDRLIWDPKYRAEMRAKKNDRGRRLWTLLVRRAG